MISIVIPIFNEEENIPSLHKRLIDASSLWNDKFEIILVDDGSWDDSFKLLKKIASKDQRFKLIKLSRNFGHQAAISSGLKHASGDAIVVMDGDLQDPPEELGRFLDKWREGYHVVYAIRKNRKEGIIKKTSYYFFYRFLGAISNIKIPIDSGDFCVMDKKVVHALNFELPENIRFIRGLRAYVGFKQIGVAYDRAERNAGEVKYTFKKLIKLAFDGIFDFSTFPLRLATYLGFFISLPSFIIGILLVFQRIFDFEVMGYSPTDTPGYATIGVGTFFIGGVILCILGIIGEYLGRIYIEVKRRPLYIIDEIVNKED